MLSALVPARPRVFVLALACSGCPSGLPDLPVRPSDAGSPAIALEPAAALDRAPRVVRIHVAGQEQADGGPRLFVFRGRMSSYDLGRVRRDEIGATLAERQVAALDFDQSPDRVVAPLEILDPGETYSVVDSAGEVIGSFAVAPDADPAIERFWPPRDAGGGVEHVVYCSDAGAVPTAQDVELDPAGIAARIGLGAGHAADDSGCVHLSAERAPEADAAVVGPPSVQGWSLDPAPLFARGGPLLQALPCASDEVEFGAGCARVSDDRLSIRSTAEPLLWILSGAFRAVRRVPAGATFEIGDLTPDLPHHVEIGMVDLASRYYVTAADFRTLASAPHVVINEVLANAVGPEPAQEWVELYNDGREAVELGGWLIEDVGGVTPLPSGSLAPGAYALLVSDAYDAAAGFDVPPVPGTLISRVPTLGKNGLSNSGEPLRLRTPNADVVSSFPAIPAPRAGVSLARRTPSAPDLDARSFGPHATPGASPGAPNELEP